LDDGAANFCFDFAFGFHAQAAENKKTAHS